MFASTHPLIRFRADRRGFTLVELLAVMGIMVILLAALLPAIKGLTQSSGQRGAVTSLMGVLDRARTMAITDGLSTYVVFVCPTGDGQQTRPDFWGRAYAIYEDHDNVSFTPEQKTSWLQLPTGVAFKIKDGGSNDGTGPYASVTNRPLVPAGQTNGDPAFTVSRVALTSGNSASLQLPYLKFDGTGTVDEQSAPLLRVLMFAGFINSSGNEISTQNNGATPGNQNALQLQEIDVNPVTGRAKYNADPSNNLMTPTPTP